MGRPEYLGGGHPLHAIVRSRLRLTCDLPGCLACHFAWGRITGRRRRSGSTDFACLSPLGHANPALYAAHPLGERQRQAVSVRLGRQLDLRNVKPSDFDPLVYRVDDLRPRVWVVAVRL